MANLPPVFDRTAITTISTYGGYSNLVPMSEITNLILLSAMPFISNRAFWQVPLNPITDTEWDEVQQWLDTAMGELMTNVAIGSIFYSIALLTDPNVVLPIGQTLVQTDYPNLTNVVPPSWLVGLNIQLPDLRDTFMIGTPSLGQVGIGIGSNTHTLSVAELATHNHVQNPHTHTEVIPSVTPTGAGPIVAGASIVLPLPSVTGLATAINNPAGSNTPHNNKPLSLQAYAYLVVR
jgi:hypothetical protein